MLKHSYAYEGSAVVCAAALANLEIIERENLVENSKVMGDYLFDQLKLLYRHKIVGEIRGGLGLNCEVELMRNRDTRERFSTDENALIPRMLKEKLMEAWLFGPFRNPIPIVPPLIITKEEIDEIVSGFDKVIGEIEKEIV